MIYIKKAEIKDTPVIEKFVIKCKISTRFLRKLCFWDEIKILYALDIFISFAYFYITAQL